MAILKGKNRVSKVDTYLNCAEVFSYRSTCIKRKYSAVMHQGEGYGICRAVHAEANALLNCSREQTLEADFYLVGINPDTSSIHAAKPCPLCARMIIQAEIRNVYLRQGNDKNNFTVVSSQELEWCQQERKEQENA